VLGNNVISSDVHMASVDAGGDRNVISQMLDHLRDLFKAAPQRILRASGVFDQDGEITLR
jgi:hypothetical protein